MERSTWGEGGERGMKAGDTFEEDSMMGLMGLTSGEAGVIFTTFT